MLKIQYMSDLHLEREMNTIFFSENPIPKIGDILILAGDITKYSKIHYNDKFFDDISEKFEQVFMIPGNHEYYAITDLDLINKPFINEKIRHNVTLLNNQNIIYKGINFIFSTMWTDISIDKEFGIKQNVKDFTFIKNGKYLITPNDIRNIFHKSLNFIENTLKENKEEKVFVVTHHAPTKLVISNFYKNSPIQDAFSVELHPLIFDNNIDYWLYGHTHENIEGEINGTKIICNQFGYVFDDSINLNFEHKIIEL